jgi:hypothetical protein
MAIRFFGALRAAAFVSGGRSFRGAFMSNVPPPTDPTSPMTSPTPQPPGDPRAMVQGPSWGLIATAGIGVLYQIVMLLWNLLGAGVGAAQGREGFMGMLSGGIGIVFNLIAIAVAGVIIFGALKMQKLQNYTLAMAASVIAMVPCISPCCILGLPLGIWALVILLKPEVKAAFDKPGF